ncbi:RING protein [Venustampulla echinocandica]|uniref:E3 ubiquitin-protein ligase listerin n=1 Tax=Venustampulla echinocandica TaxID=2656787 RepID=A0A370TFU9_9HELO|nr:RING protein [Venustampulla echinocandica]RDL33780.1 RING protein [Venustampulla echinocandica]
MSKRQFKTQASSSRAAAAKTFGGFGSISTGSRSILSYVTELPDLSTITDPNIVVAFKSLSKTDATTKAKALETLQDYVSRHPHSEGGGTEDSILEAWVRFYPRLSINNNRRVREQSHTLQFMLLKSARKRMEKRIPETVGSWLAGCYDRDGFVARAAQNGIASFLDTDDKVTAFWTRCQSQILDYAQEAINESAETLSDERNTSKDDSEALYLRVIGSGISLVTKLLSKLKKDDIVKYQDKYEDFLRTKKLWALAASGDPFIRKILDNFLIVCLEKQTDMVQTSLDRISHGFIAKGLRASQATSSLQLLQALKCLTSRFPEVWTSHYKDKDGGSSFRRLRGFVQKGSQGGPAGYWVSLQELLSILPAGVLPSDKDAVLDFLGAFKGAIEGREEPAQHAEQAWLSYFTTFRLLVAQIPDAAAQAELFREAIYPIFERYLQGEKSRSLVTSPALAKSYYIWASTKSLKPQDSLSFYLQKLANGFIARALTSNHIQPVGSEAHKQGQRKVIGEGHRWFSLVAEILKTNDPEDSAQLIWLPSRGIVSSALSTIIAEDARPYWAAAIVEIAMRLTPVVVKDSPKIMDSIRALIEDYLPQRDIILSPSSRHLVSILYVFRSISGQEPVFEKAWMSITNSLISAPSDPSSLRVFTTLLANDDASKLSQASPGLQKVLVDANLRALEGEPEARSLFETAITFNCYTESSAATILEQVLHCFDSKNQGPGTNLDKLNHAFNTLEFVSRHKPNLLNQDKSSHMLLITMLLEITEISDTSLASRASALKSVIERGSKTPGQIEPDSALDLIRWNLELEPNSPRILLIETLVQQAKSCREGEKSAPAAAFFPNAKKWTEALEPILGLTPNPALGVMRPWAGAVFVGADQAAANSSAASMKTKSFAIALRMALYTSKFTDDMDMILGLPKETLVEILLSLVLTAEVLNDQLDSIAPGEFPEWATEDDDEMDELRDLTSNTRLAVMVNSAKGWQRSNISQDTNVASSSIVQALIDKLLKTAIAGPGQYYGARALGHLIASLVDAHGWDPVSGDSWLSDLGILSPSTINILGATAVLTGLESNLKPSRLINTFCNRLISDVAGASATSEKTLGLLVLLNATLAVYSGDELPVAKNRLIFATKQILSWTPTLAKTDYRIASEACRALQVLLPAMIDVYGTYWETTLEFCISIWNSAQDGELSDESLPMTGMSLKLYSILRKLEDPNDDLIEALAEHNKEISKSLVDLLKLRRPMEHQPLDFVDTLLLRQLRDVPLDHVEDLSEFYPLIATDSRNLQSAAYDVLHRALPAAQQQISVDVLLENQTARLPDELLSLLLDPPSIPDFSDEMLEEFPTSIRGYLLSWHLVFDSYSNASFRVRNDYSEVLKSENYIGPLLGFLFDILGHSAGKPVDLDRQHIESPAILTYDMWAAIDSESPKRDVWWLLINLYYLSLQYTPNLVKNWWLDCKSKQTSIAVSKWTEKFFSPLLIREAKDEVSKWADEQDTASEDEKDLIIKVSKNTPTIQAGYEVDEMMMQIIISLPDNYPLQGVEVRGENRVAVKEKMWNSWLRTTQGVMTFNNGSIVDGLTVFRRNVVAALKGQTECAICYSIISSDKRMPDKRCQTCKNLFHSGCLYKWFQSSNQSTCPLCRNPFNYGSDTARRTRDPAGQA